MSDEIVEQSVPTPEVPEPTATAEVVTPSEPTPAVEPPQTGTSITEPPAEDVTVFKAVIDGEEQTFDLKDTEQRKQAQEFVRQGAHYTKKMQGMSEWEKANQQKVQSFDQLSQNQTVMKMMLAASQGLDPALVTANPQPPDQRLLEIDPQVYYRQQAQYEVTLAQKQLVDGQMNAYINNATQVNTRAAFEKAKLKNDMTEQEFQDVQNFVQMRMKPSGLGYTDQDVEYAVSAVLGRNRQTKAVLQTTKKINETLKNASNQVQAQPKNTKPVELSEKQRRDKEYLDFVKERGSR